MAESRQNEATLSQKLSANDAALRAAGDSGSKTQALAAELEQAKADLASARSQLADAAKDRESSVAAARGDSDKRVTELTDKLNVALQSYAVLQEENNRLKRSSPLRPSTPAAALAVQSSLPTPTPTPAPRQYVVVDGDTLTKISLRYYGTANKWLTIYQANRDKLPNERTLSIGTVLRIP